MMYVIETKDGLEYPVSRSEIESRFSISLGNRINFGTLKKLGVFQLIETLGDDTPKGSYAQTSEIEKYGEHYFWVIRDLTEDESKKLKRDLCETVKKEAAKRIDNVAPIWRQVNRIRENPSDPMFKKIDVIRKKSNMIEAHLDTLTDVEASVYDIENSPFWD